MQGAPGERGPPGPRGFGGNEVQYIHNTDLCCWWYFFDGYVSLFLSFFLSYVFNKYTVALFHRVNQETREHQAPWDLLVQRGNREVRVQMGHLDLKDLL